MNILILNWRDIKNPKKGGAEIILYELSKRLIKDNNCVTWFSSAFKGAKNLDSFDGIKFVRRGNEFTVYIHAFFYYLNLAKKPDLVLDCVNTVCWKTSIYVPQKKRVLYANQSARHIFFYEYPFFLALLFYFLEPIQYLTYKNAKTLCYSKSIKQDLISFGIPNSLINVVNLGIDHSRYKKDKKFNNPTFLFVGRFVKNKRADVCILAIRHVINKYSNVTLYLVGYGEEEKNLQDMIKKNDLEKNVIIVNKKNDFLEKNSKDEKVKIMQKAWALILPSVKEGWGMVVTEAAACGTPSIVSNVSGLKDSVIQNKTGIVLSENPDEFEIANAMEKIIKDDFFRKNLSNNAIKFSSSLAWEKSYKTFQKYLF